jgi:nucleotide-binding universal stress UspA family protein
MTEHSETAMRPIVVAYDGSGHARAAVERAGALLPGHHAIVICVWAPITYSASSARLGATAGVLMDSDYGFDAVARERAEQLAEEGAELAQDAGLNADARAVQATGAAWHGIVRCADEFDAALIVTGTRGRSTMAAALLGSTAQGILHHARRPVLVVAGDR